MTSEEEPPTKRRCTSYELCLFCQEETVESLVDTRHENFKNESYETFLCCLHKRADLGNVKFFAASKRLHDVSTETLHEKKATWHGRCYKLVTNRAHLNRDKEKFQSACSTKSISNLTNRKRGRPSATTTASDIAHEDSTHTRSQSAKYNRNQCFFCQTDINETLHACSSQERGTKFTEIVHKSENPTWKIQLGDVITTGDLLARDILYHSSCYTRNWEKFVQRPQRRKSSATNKAKCEDSVKSVAAEVEFICIVQHRIDSGEYIPITELEKLYRDIVDKYDIPDAAFLSRAQLKQLLTNNVENIAITCPKGSAPSIVHSCDLVAAAVRVAASSQRGMQGTLKILFQSGNIIRAAIKQQAPWTFQGPLRGSLSAGIPQELLSLIRWIIQGTSESRTELRKEEMKRSCALIGQHVIQEFKSDRQIQYNPASSQASFRTMHETPSAVGLSLQSHHRHRDAKDIKSLHHTGTGISYDRVKEITTSIACAVQKNMVKFSGVYVPPGLLKHVPIRCSADNIDARVDTSDGRNTFHGTSVAVYQRLPPDVTNYDTVAEPLALDEEISPDSLQPVSSTVSEMSECSVTGNPKPDRSPHYPNFQLGQYKETIVNANLEDIAWLLARYYQQHRPVTPEVGLPVWSAYNSLVSSSNKDREQQLDSDHILPIVNAPAYEWRTLVTVLETLYKLNLAVCPNDPGKVLVTLDMDLYKRALKLEYLQAQYSGKWMLCPGGFHIVLCALRCLGRTVEHSGLDEAWSEDLYSRETVSQIISGKHFNRAIEAHETTLEVLFDLWFSEFLSERPEVSEAMETCIDDLINARSTCEGMQEAHTHLLIVIEELNLEKQLRDFDDSHKNLPMFRWARMYMKQVMVMLNFLRSLKSPDPLLYLASLEAMCIYFFSYNRLDYAQNITEYIARVSQTQEADPKTWSRFLGGEFSLTKNSIPFTGIGIDQGQEFLNKILKGDGGLRGLTNKPTSLLKYCLCAPELARLATETDEMIGVMSSSRTHHHHLTKAKFSQRQRSVRLLSAVLLQCNPFRDNSPRLYNLVTKQVVPQTIEDDILNMEERGQQALQSFVQQRICGPTNLWDKMTKLKFLTWSDACKTTKLKGEKAQMELKATSSLFARMLLIAKSNRNIDLEDVISNHEFASVNQTLLNADGSLIPCVDKSEVIHVLENMPTQVESEPGEKDFTNTHLIIDGMSLVHELLSTTHPKTCQELANAFTRTLEHRCKNYECTRLIFDNYLKQHCIKDIIRHGQTNVHTKSAGFHVVDATPIVDSKSFLSSNTTKDSLTLYLAEKAIRMDIPMVTSTRLHVHCNQEHLQPTTEVSSHEEADTIMILHAAELGAAGKTVHLMTQDTDVLVLALRRLPFLGSKASLIMGTGERRRQVSLKPIYDELGASRAAALPGFHCLTGCDTCGHIRGKSKKAAFNTFCKASQDVYTALTHLGTGDIPSPSVVSGCEEFLCQLMSSKNESVKTPRELRWRRFKSKPTTQSIDKIPPTAGAWYQHIIRAHFQAYIWNQDIVLHPDVPDPCTLGWAHDIHRVYVPVLSTVPPAPAAVVELVRCGCGISNCSRRCTCRQNNLACTEMCKCEADEDCANTVQRGHDVDTESEEED